MKRILCLSVILLLIAFSPSHGNTESWLYEDGGKSKVGAILCHGKGGDPESYVVDPLRLELHEQLAYHTISLQMPGGKKVLAEYEADFPAAYSEINRALVFLQQKGVTQIILIAHSLGSRMATSYLAENPQAAIQAFIGVGMLNNGELPFSCLANLQQTTLPVLDIWGESGRAGDNKYALERRMLLAPRYTQVGIPGADHALSEHEEELVEAVVHWLKGRE